MPLKFVELKILQASETISDDLWNEVYQWDPFARDVVGKQITRAADSIGANIAEAYGRFHFGEKVPFLYYARGSLFETKYWLNRIKERHLLEENLVRNYSSKLSELARQLNKFISDLKTQQRNIRTNEKTLSEDSGKFNSNQQNGSSSTLFEEEDL